MIVPLYLISFSMSIAKAQDQNQTMNKPENVNVPSSDTVVEERINITSDNQTQQQNLLPSMQPSQQMAPPMTPPPSTPRYPIPPLPFAESNNQPIVILSQSLYFNNVGDPLGQLGQLLGYQQPSSIGSMHIVGEVFNQASMTANSVKIIATFYNANGQVIGTDSAYADPSDLASGQRAPFDINVSGESVPMYLMSSYGLTVDSQ